MIKVNKKEVEFKTFPNGETLLVHESIRKSLHKDKLNQIHFKYENDSDLIKLMFVKEYLDSLTGIFNLNFVLVVYYMPYSRMDRSEELSPFTLKYVSKFINDLNFGMVFLVEPHSDVTPALIDKSQSLYINFDLIEKVKEEIGFNEENDYIMFPDAGASKRYNKMEAKNVVIGNKQRDFQTGKILGLELTSNSEATGKKAIIVDDLSSYGGTFVHSAKALREKGFEEIYLLVAHAENAIFKGELFNHIDLVFTTDSILTEQDNWENKKFEHQLKIYKLDEVLAELV